MVGKLARRCAKSVLGVLLVICGYLALCVTGSQAAERSVQSLYPYWTPDINQRFADTYARCALATLKTAVESGSASFDEAELSIGKQCRGHLTAIIEVLRTLGLSTKEAKSLINQIYKDKQYILIEFYTDIATRRDRDRNERAAKEQLDTVKGDHLKCVQDQSAKYALLLSESADTVVRAAIGYCKPQEDAVASTLVPLVIGNGGNGADTMKGYMENVAQNATALVLELRTKQVESLPGKTEKTPPIDGGI